LLLFVFQIESNGPMKIHQCTVPMQMPSGKKKNSMEKKTFCHLSQTNHMASLNPNINDLETLSEQPLRDAQAEKRLRR